MRTCMAVVACLSLTGCDYVFGLRDDLDLDAAVADDDVHPRVDTPIPPGCTAWGAIEILATGGDDPTLRADRLELLAVGNDSGVNGKQLFHATRASESGGFGDFSQLGGVNAFQDDWDPALSGDGLTLVWRSYRPYGQPHLFLARRPSIGMAFAGVTQLDDTVQGIGGIDLSPDGATLYVSTGTGSSDVLYQVVLADTTLGAKLSIGRNIQFPSVSADGLTLYAHDAQSNLYTLTRISTDDPFEPATRTVFDTGGFAATDPDISADNETLTYQAQGRGIAMLRRTCTH